MAMGFTKYPIRHLDDGGYFPHKAGMTNLIQDIEAFCTTHEMSKSQFGVMALNDKNLVPQLRGESGKRPRRLWPETEAKVRREMATYLPAAKQGAAA